ncbi:miniconductance mechanosensitive channel [Arenibacter nanhaiticus]|uniref:Mechanosensing system component YbdG n=1 Tax=Arenibacter nanhaiticus TaxID=558155 RepID=A0A1M6FBI6_9FLAO|nr:mechanosensitive ion channel domain-containing protein [Arenibacter nanhaiticus]SHI95033.1 miniconductance mechanosensitive channel [Arenibacter nanhaiticus]
MTEQKNQFFIDYLTSMGVSQSLAEYLNLFGLFILTVLLAFLLDLLIWKVLRIITVRIARKSKTNFDNFLVTNRVPRYFAHIIPLLLVWEALPFIFLNFSYLGSIGSKLTLVIGVILTLQIISSLLRSVNDYLKTLERFKDKPINSYIQVFMIFAWIAGILTVFAIVTGTSIWKFFTALGAASAVILLIFKDSILGLVASIQVSINDMLRIGDWITFDKYGADGNVTEINLATVKVQNFDKTITTIPTYALISDSFKNWRGMEQSAGRRIKRSLIIKQNSIKFLNSEEVESLKRVQIIQRYITDRNDKINSYNTENNRDKSLVINGRNLTNIGVFRKYVETYLENHSAINKKMTLMVRQLSPTPQGIPIEIYAFSSDKRWENYEYIIADIFDHLLAAVPYFDLEVYELPSTFSIQKEK